MHQEFKDPRESRAYNKIVYGGHPCAPEEKSREQLIREANNDWHMNRFQRMRELDEYIAPIMKERSKAIQKAHDMSLERTRMFSDRMGKYLARHYRNQ